jgi:hypothetical protein
VTSHQPTEKMSSWGHSAFYYACSLVSLEACRLQSAADSDALRFCTFTGLFLFFSSSLVNLNLALSVPGYGTDRLGLSRTRADSELEFHRITLRECSRGPSATLSS